MYGQSHILDILRLYSEVVILCLALRLAPHLEDDPWSFLKLYDQNIGRDVDALTDIAFISRLGTPSACHLYSYHSNIMETSDTHYTSEDSDLITPTPCRRVAFAEDIHMEVGFVLIREIPKIKYHEAPLRFISQPGISQKDYERRVLFLSSW